ncbi:MAG: hypothetical protein HC810_05580 [Acaryochloridaceae cyanobacterium RL_2_7]|nr:hypothetical protein [Acaryochloridaceae cyanobacterium RL_2_7]
MRRRSWKIFPIILAGLLACFLAIGMPRVMRAQISQPSHADDASTPAVQLGPISLFEIHRRSGSFSEQERAEAISNRLLQLIKADGFSAERLTTKKQTEGVEVLVDQQVIMLVTAQDAEQAGISIEKLAQSHIDSIKAGFEEYDLTYGNDTLLIRSAIAGGVTLLFLLILGVFQKVIPKVHRRIVSLKGQKIRAFRFQSFGITV